MSLINGMDDIMTYIKNQDILVKKLTEENKKLQLKNKELNKELEYDADTSFADLTDEIKKLKEENSEEDRDTLNYWRSKFENAEEEIKGLQEEVNDRVVIEDIAHAFGSEEGEDFDWESGIHELKASFAVAGAATELNSWRDELIKAFKSFEEHDAEDVTREDLDPEFVGAWISDALKRDQQHYDMKEEREKAIGEMLTVLLKVK